MQRRILAVAALVTLFGLAAPAIASANHVGGSTGISWSNTGSAQGIAHRSPTGTAMKLTHDGVNYGRPRI